MYIGTPAGGAGIHGCIEMGSSVLGLCYDEHHMTHLAPILVQRAVEAMLGSNSVVFNNEALMTRAKQLKVTKDDKDEKKDDQKKDKKEEKKKDKSDDEEEKKKKKNKKCTSSDSTSSSEYTEEEEGEPAKKKKKKEC